MLVFATSDKGGTGRSVTSSNVVYRWALQGRDGCYLDFDFGSPTVGAIFNISSAVQGTTAGGLHAYLNGEFGQPQRLNVWQESDRSVLRGQPPGAGRLVLFPGDLGGSEFPVDRAMVRRCVELLLRLEEEFEACFVDLSAGRSYATDLVLAATAEPELRDVTSRWLVFHRWTRQHVIAAAGLIHGRRGLLETGVARGHDPDRLGASVRLVRTAVMDPDSAQLAGLSPSQVAWLRQYNDELQDLARRHRVGRVSLLGTVPLDPVLQWREQLISDHDVLIRKIANQETVDAFRTLAGRLDDPSAWELL